MLGRLYAPTEFGVFSLYMTVLSTASVFACLGYEPAIVMAKDDRDARRLLALGLGFALGVSGVALVAIAALNSVLESHVGLADLVPLLWWLPINLLIVGLSLLLTNWRIRQQGFARLAASRISTSAATALAQVGVGVVRGGPGTLVLGQLFGQMVGVAVLFGAPVAPAEPVRREGERTGYGRLVRQYRDFTLYSTWGTLMNATAFQMVPVIVYALFGPAVAGFYFWAGRLVGAPMSLIGAALGQVLFQRAAATLGGDRRLDTLVAPVVARSIITWAIVFAMLAAVSPAAFRALLGPEWEDAGRYVRVLAPLFYAQVVTSPVSVVLIALERQRVVAMLQAALFVTALGSLSIAGLLSGSAVATLAVYAGSQAVVYAIYLGIVLKASSTPWSAVVKEMLALGALTGRLARNRCC